MDVGTADRDRADLEQDVVVVDVWNRDFAGSTASGFSAYCTAAGWVGMSAART
jgi:hypothetical protein